MGQFTPFRGTAIHGTRFEESVSVRRSRRTAASDPDVESDTKRARLLDRLPGARERAPRRNALVGLAYVLLCVLFVTLFGRLFGLVPLSVPC